MSTERLPETQFEIPYSFNPLLNSDLEKARLINSRLSKIQKDIATLKTKDMTVGDRAVANDRLGKSFDDWQFSLAKAHTVLVTDVYESEAELTDDQKIYFDSLIKHIDGDKGFDFQSPNLDVARFKYLRPGSPVIIMTKTDGDMVLAADGDLAEFPTVKLLFNEDDHTLDAEVTYQLVGAEPISKLWNESIVFEFFGQH